MRWRLMSVLQWNVLNLPSTSTRWPTLFAWAGNQRIGKMDGVFVWAIVSRFMDWRRRRDSRWGISKSPLRRRYSIPISFSQNRFDNGEESPMNITWCRFDPRLNVASGHFGGQGSKYTDSKVIIDLAWFVGRACSVGMRYEVRRSMKMN